MLSFGVDGFLEVSVFILKSMFWRAAQNPSKIRVSAHFALFCAALQNIDFRIKNETSTKKLTSTKQHPALNEVRSGNT